MQYRREIDGLRAIAILPVILFHAGFEIFSGGYVGVDVFFVISGYLITSIIMSEQATGHFTWSRFYERRARRILPALLFVLACCLPAAWVLLLPSDMREFVRSLVAVSTFSSNIFFWGHTGYFDTASELKPLLHTWSLAVEEQFYLLFPIVAIALSRRGKAQMIAVVSLLWTVSFVLCTRLLDLHPSTAFFLLPTRAWELLTGSLLAMSGTHGGKVSLRWREPLAIASLGMVLYSVFVFDSTTPIPGPQALWPVLGTTGLLAFADAQTRVGKLLGGKPLVVIGLISYSAYLWHQPVFAFVRHAATDRPDAAHMAPWAALSLVLGWLSWRFVERPFRRPTLRIGRPLFIVAIGLPLLCLALQKAARDTQGFEQRFALPAEIARSMTAQFPRTDCERPADAMSELPQFCRAGALSRTPPRAALFGDSHLGALLPAFDDIGKRQGESFVHAWLGACPPLLDVFVLRGFYRPDVCPDLARAELDYVKQRGIKTVYLVGRWSLYTDGGYDGDHFLYLGITANDPLNKQTSRAAFEHGVDQTIEAYRRIGVTPYWVEQVPEQRVDVRQAYYKWADKRGAEKLRNEVIQAHALAVADHVALQGYNRDVVKRHESAGEVHIIRLDDALCDPISCRIGDATHSFYRDSDHLSAIGALQTVNALARSVRHP